MESSYVTKLRKDYGVISLTAGHHYIEVFQRAYALTEKQRSYIITSERMHEKSVYNFKSADQTHIITLVKKKHTIILSEAYSMS